MTIGEPGCDREDKRRTKVIMSFDGNKQEIFYSLCMPLDGHYWRTLGSGVQDALASSRFCNRNRHNSFILSDKHDRGLSR